MTATDLLLGMILLILIGLIVFFIAVFIAEMRKLTAGTIGRK